MPHKVCLQEATSSKKWESCVSSQWTLPIFAVLHLCHRTTQGEIASSVDQPLKFQLFGVCHTENLGPFPVIKVCHKSGRCSPWRLDFKFKSASSFHTVSFHGCSLKLTQCPVASWRTALSTLAQVGVCALNGAASMYKCKSSRVWWRYVRVCTRISIIYIYNMLMFIKHSVLTSIYIIYT